MLVSVICTVKNGAQFIEETVESIRNQTFSKWEMIIVDDGSMDGTLPIVYKLCQQEARLRVIETTGIGRGRALNFAVEQARGVYIANIDADNPAHPERLERQYQLLEERRDIACLVTRSVVVHGTSIVIWPPVGEQRLLQITAESLFRRNPINHSSLFIRKSTLQRIGGYDEARVQLLDYELWLRLATRGHAIYESSEQLAVKRLYNEQSYKKRLRYLLATRKLKRDFIGQVSPSFKYYALANLSVVYGLLPHMLRYPIKKVAVKL